MDFESIMEQWTEVFAAIQCPVSVEEQVELLNKEKLMLDESKGIFPAWKCKLSIKSKTLICKKLLYIVYLP